ncbi:hypothetical protein DB345_11630 [Spartobacteria bacterium LR76]|nr:hypothetical protein DB345_11630 [Spartobacteria bacterium LR76]
MLARSSGDESSGYLAPPDNPAGKVMTFEEAAALRGDLFPKPVYLVGIFHVTAAGQTRMVLRQDGLRNVRLVVDLAAGLKVPPEGTTVRRNADLPFIVENVQLGPDGQITVYAIDKGSWFLDKAER